MEKIIVYHGSINIIDKPTYGIGKKYNDYGLGFYTTKDIELAKEWAVDINNDGYANIYELDLKDLKVLDLSNMDTLNWIAILLKNRQFSISNDVSETGKKYLLENYLLSYENYDIIIGYRADDAYFSFADDFLKNRIPLNILSDSLRLGNLGMQIVLKSKKAFSKLKFIGYEKASKDIYYPLREKRNKEAKEKFILLEKQAKPNDTYLIDIIRGGAKK